MSKKLNPKLDRAIQKVIESADGVATQEAWKGDPRLGWKYDVAVNDLVVDKEALLNVVRELMIEAIVVYRARGPWADETADAILYPESWP